GGAMRKARTLSAHPGGERGQGAGPGGGGEQVTTRVVLRLGQGPPPGPEVGGGRAGRHRGQRADRYSGPPPRRPLPRGSSFLLYPVGTANRSAGTAPRL